MSNSDVFHLNFFFMLVYRMEWNGRVMVVGQCGAQEWCISCSWYIPVHSGWDGMAGS